MSATPEAEAATAAAGATATRNQDLHGLPLPFECSTPAPKTLLELKLISLAGAIRDKPRWQEKFRDPDISERWRNEYTAQAVTQDMLSYVWQQLEHEVAVWPGPITQGAVPGVFTADGIVAGPLLQALQQEVSVVEQAYPKDWHPGSDEQVLDLVHPSLYCLVYGVSKRVEQDRQAPVTLLNCLQLIGSGTTVSCTPKQEAGSGGYHSDHETNWDQSTRFQWLPTDFDVDADGKVQALSYINNLHPRHTSLYATICSLLEVFLPLFEAVLTDLKAGPQPNVIEVDPYDWYGEPPEDDDDDVQEQWYEDREPRLPTPPTEYTPPASVQGPAVDLKGRRLQVIVKLANIQLTPEAPRYPGGSWHVEGMRNEAIVASGIYYYDQDNITDSRLAFRTAVDEPNYEQSDNKGISMVYGLENDEALNQVLGAVTTLEGRCLAFPNIYQHQVQPFELKDKSQPGHRKILVFFLVDPAQSIPSTSDIPPQQCEWMMEVLSADAKSHLGQLPAQAVDLVSDFFGEVSDCPFSLTKAKEYREGLMQERKFFVNDQNERIFEREFSLCEH